MNPRPYQLEVLDKISRGFVEFDKQLAVLPTGAGKTCIFSWLAERRLPQRTLILAHREELIDQAIAKLHAATGILAAKEKAEDYASLSAPVVVASIQTMIRRVDRWPRDHFSLVVADEAHHAISSSWQTVLQHFTGQVLGVTATADRGDKKNLGEYFQNVAAEISLFDLIDAGYLSRITVKSIPLEINLNGVKSSMGDFDEADLGHALEPYLGRIAQAIREHASFRRVLAFLPLIATSQKFVAACQAVGLSAVHIDGKDPERKSKLESFAAWEFDVLSNAMLLTEGYDDPGIDCIIVLRPTRSRPLFAQMVGRGTRIEQCKENLLLLDFLWLHEKHAICRPANLIAKSDEEAEQITKLAQEPGPGGGPEQLDIQGIATRATAQREEALRKKLAEQRNKKAKTISAEEFAVRHNAMDVAEFEPTMKWESQSVSEKQGKVLKRAGIDLATVRGKGHASKLIDLIFHGQTLVLASVKQRALMARMGHPSPDTATQDEARRFFAELRRQEVV